LPVLERTLKTINEVMKQLNIDATVKKTRIANEEEAKRHRFPGSPTVLINGVDIDPKANKETTGGFIGCRIYQYQGQTYEYPPKQMIKTAFKRLTRQ